MTIKVRQLHPNFVGEVSALDLAADLPPHTVAELMRAIDRYAVLVFPEQSLDDDRLLALGRRFGHIEPPRNHRVERRLSMPSSPTSPTWTPATSCAHATITGGWMRSATNCGTPMPRSARHPVRCRCCLRTWCLQSEARRSSPTCAAYDLLSPAMRAKIEGLVCEHSIFHSRSQLGHTDYTEAERAALPPAHHRLVRAHPGSKRKTLYMGAHASHIVGWPVPDGRLLLRDLMSTRPSASSSTGTAGAWVTW